MSQKGTFSMESAFAVTDAQQVVVDELLLGLEQGEQHQTLLGVTGSGKTFVIANVIAQSARPAIVMAPNKTLAAQFYAELRRFFPNNAVEYFVSYYDYYQPEAYVPASDTYIAKDASINQQVEQMRLSATKAILEQPDCIIVATVSAIYGLGDPRTYLAMVLHLSVGEKIDQRDILRRLTEIQYKRNDQVLQRGCYRVRGDVVEIFSADSQQEVLRVELFDDRVERLSMFDPLTQKVSSRLPRATVFPKTHYVTPRVRILSAIESVKIELKQRLDELERLNDLVARQRLEQRTLFDIEMMLEIGYCSGIENYSRYLSRRPAGDPPPTLMDYLPDNAMMIIDESHVTVPQIGGMYHGDRSRKQNLVQYGFRLPSALDNRPLNFDEFCQLQPQTIYVSATPRDYELQHSNVVAELLVRPTGLIDPPISVRPTASQVDDMLSEISLRVKKQQRVLIGTLTKRMAEDLTDYLAEHGVRVRYLHSDVGTVERVEIIRDLRLGEFDVLVGINLLREGLDLPEVSLVAIFDADKEGFLRSDKALIQTMGRAARHLEGEVILYADRITGSMQRAMSESERRRTIQLAYNEEHGITPAGIKKAIDDLLQTEQQAAAEEYIPLTFEEQLDWQSLNQHEVAAGLQLLEKEMLHHAEDLAFELAAELRDKITYIQQEYLLSR